MRKTRLTEISKRVATYVEKRRESLSNGICGEGDAAAAELLRHLDRLPRLITQIRYWAEQKEMSEALRAEMRLVADELSELEYPLS